MSTYVPPSGPSPCKWMLVVDGPTKEDSNRRRFLSGKAGAELDRFFDNYHAPSRERWYTTGLMKSLPAAKDYTPEEVAENEGYFLGELRRVQPAVVVAMGRRVTHWFCGERYGVDELHGLPRQSDRTDALVFPCIHPLHGLLSPEAYARFVKDMATLELCLKGELEAPPTDDGVGDYRLLHGPVEVAQELGDWAGDLGVDTEGTVERPWSVQFSKWPGHGFVIRAGDLDGLAVLREHLRRYRNRIVFHNALWDLAVMRAMGIDVVAMDVPFTDTMISAYLLAEPQGLKSLGLRLAGMEQSEYMELVAEPAEVVAREWLASLAWERFERNYGPKPNDLEKALRLVERMLLKDAKTPVRERWANGRAREILQDELSVVGDMPEPTLDMIPLEKAVRYACLSKGSLVETPQGYVAIDKLVRQRYTGTVRSLDAGGRFCWKPVTGWYEIVERKGAPRLDWKSVTTEFTHASRWGVGTRYTPDHQLLTERGWVAVADLKVGVDKLVLPVPGLTAVQRQVAIGSMLGDGWVNQRNPSGWGILHFSNNEAQFDYVMWKSELCGDLTRSLDVRPEGSSLPNARRHYAITCSAHPQMLEFSCAGKKRLGSWIDDLSELGLAIWYQDDGTLVTDSTPRLYTNGFSRAEVEGLREVLARKWGLVTNRIKASGREYQWFIAIPSVSAARFFELVAPHIHPAMAYKLPAEWHGRFVLTTDTETPSPVQGLVLAVDDARPAKGGGFQTQFCLDVEETHNFCTMGEVAHNCRDTDLTIRVAPVLEDQIAAMGLQKPLELDLGIVAIVERMQHVGMLVDVPYLKDLSSVLASEYDMTVEMICNQAGKEINPNSGPQVAEWLFDDLGLPWKKKTKGGDRPATDKKILEALSKNYDLAPEQRQAVDLILEAREILKVKTTFCDQIGDYVRADGRLHPHLLLTRTGTGRTAAKDPNILAFPKHSKRGKLIRGGFVAAPGRILAEFDLSQAELRMLAIDSGDTAMQKEFLAGLDKHVLTSALHIFKMDPAELQRRYEADDPEAKELRFAGKSINFGVVMGITEHGLLDQFHKNGNLDWTEPRCVRLLMDWHKAYPEASAYLKGKHAEARRFGYVRNWTGRLRYLEGVHSADKYAKQEALRQAQATPIQSGARDIMKSWLAEIWKRLPEVREKYWCEAILDIHDAALLELDEEAFPLVERIMHETLASIQQWAIPVTCDGKRGLSWGDL